MSFSTRVRKLAGTAVSAVFVTVLGLPLVCKLCKVELVEPLGEYRFPTVRPRPPRV